MSDEDLAIFMGIIARIPVYVDAKLQADEYMVAVADYKYVL